MSDFAISETYSSATTPKWAGDQNNWRWWMIGSLGEPNLKLYRIILKWIFKKLSEDAVLIEVACEYGHNLSGSLKSRKFFDQLSICYSLKKDSAA